MAPRTMPDTGRSVPFFTSAVTVTLAVASEGRSRSVTTWGFRSAIGPLRVTYTSPQRPMFLSAGVGFQSTHMMARSCGSGPVTSTATAFVAPGLAIFVTSNS
jgi:hypothetical protein